MGQSTDTSSNLKEFNIKFAPVSLGLNGELKFLGEKCVMPNNSLEFKASYFLHYSLTDYYYDVHEPNKSKRYGYSLGLSYRYYYHKKKSFKIIDWKKRYLNPSISFAYLNYLHSSIKSLIGFPLLLPETAYRVEYDFIKIRYSLQWNFGGIKDIGEKWFWDVYYGLSIHYIHIHINKKYYYDKAQPGDAITKGEIFNEILPGFHLGFNIGKKL